MNPRNIRSPTDSRIRAGRFIVAVVAIGDMTFISFHAERVRALRQFVSNPVAGDCAPQFALRPYHKLISPTRRAQAFTITNNTMLINELNNPTAVAKLKLAFSRPTLYT